MVSKASACKGSAQSIDYIMNEEKKGYELCRQDLIGENGKEILSELREVQAFNERCKNNTFSIVLSPNNDQTHTKAELLEYTKKHLENLGLSDHQYIACVHQNTKATHVHIIANRVGDKGKAVSDSYIGYKAQHSAEKIAQEYGMKTAKEIRAEKHLDKDLNLIVNKELKSEIFKAHNQCIKNSSSFAQYKQNMYDKGYKIHESINKQGKLQGFKIESKSAGITFKASEIHKKCGLKLMLQSGMSFGNALLSSPLASLVIPQPVLQAINVISKISKIGRSL